MAAGHAAVLAEARRRGPVARRLEFAEVRRRIGKSDPVGFRRFDFQRQEQGFDGRQLAAVERQPERCAVRFANLFDGCGGFAVRGRTTRRAKRERRCRKQPARPPPARRDTHRRRSRLRNSSIRPRT